MKEEFIPPIAEVLTLECSIVCDSTCENKTIDCPEDTEWGEG